MAESELQPMGPRRWVTAFRLGLAAGVLLNQTNGLPVLAHGLSGVGKSRIRQGQRSNHRALVLFDLFIEQTDRPVGESDADQRAERESLDQQRQTQTNDAGGEQQGPVARILLGDQGHGSGNDRGR